MEFQTMHNRPSVCRRKIRQPSRRGSGSFGDGITHNIHGMVVARVGRKQTMFFICLSVVPFLSCCEVAHAKAKAGRMIGTAGVTVVYLVSFAATIETGLSAGDGLMLVLGAGLLWAFAYVGFTIHFENLLKDGSSRQVRALFLDIEL
eukprot:217657-Amphidinium_carterae.1